MGSALIEIDQGWVFIDAINFDLIAETVLFLIEYDFKLVLITHSLKRKGSGITNSTDVSTLTLVYNHRVLRVKCFGVLKFDKIV